jgi:hypothetical protein
VDEGQEIHLKNDHNVYILGAGFSVPAGLPTIATFTNTMRDAVFWLRKNQRQREAEAIDRVLQFRSRVARAGERVPLDLEDIEEVFSLASASDDISLMRDATIAIAATLDFASITRSPGYLSIHLRSDSDLSIPKGWSLNRNARTSINGLQAWPISCPLYDRYLLPLTNGPIPIPEDRADTFITFNYDVLVEMALRSLGISVDYGFRKFRPKLDATFNPVDKVRADPVQVLKLHGSVNWAEMEGDLTIFGSYADVRAKDLSPMLVPPTWNKTVGPALADVWNRAVEALRTATRIIVIGYSIPPGDNHFKYLLATGLQENISLRKIVFVNPDSKTIGERIPRLLRDLSSRLDVDSLDAQSFILYRTDSIGRSVPSPFVA